jgi:hypothetical protein
MGRAFAGIIAIIAWAALILQLYLMVSGKGIPVPGYDPTTVTMVVNFFSYFTILSNISVALLTTSVAFWPESAMGRFFTRSTVAASVQLFIAVTGLIYFFILRKLWNPVGAQYAADAGLHYVTPVLFTLYWLFFVPKGRLRMGNVPSMLIFPLAYGAYALIRGAITQAVYPSAIWYPYPFIDVSEIGYPRTLLNIVGVTFVFAVVGSIFVVIDHAIGRNRRA